ncbi:hypothetical protein AN958_06510 [Leucoagaricus sp. SymC.cos]|nr:hypothetical protein AN958_06510 [Leucoagaricus sp. SymC.cos]
MKPPGKPPETESAVRKRECDLKTRCETRVAKLRVRAKTRMRSENEMRNAKCEMRNRELVSKTRDHDMILKT